MFTDCTEASFLCFLLKNQVVTWTRHEEKVNMLYLFGEYILSADAKGDIFIWAFRGADPSSEPVGNISLGEKFTPTCIMHPDTYLNKVPEIIYSFEIIWFQIRWPLQLNQQSNLSQNNLE
jgi:hypothetical protein